MGVAVYDYDANGWLDVFLTHFTGEYNTLYRNLGSRGFEDVSSLTGMREPSWTKLGFGTVMSDFNFDGHPDVFVTNGHIDPYSPDGDGYEMSPQVLTFVGDRWRDVSAHRRGPSLRVDTSAAGRVRRTGTTTAISTSLWSIRTPPSLCCAMIHRTVSGSSCSSAVLQANESAIGTRVEVTCSGKRFVQELVGGTSYASSHQRALFFGLGDEAPTCDITVYWPSGAGSAVSGDRRQSIADPVRRAIRDRRSAVCGPTGWIMSTVFRRPTGRQLSCRRNGTWLLLIAAIRGQHAHDPRPNVPVTAGQAVERPAALCARRPGAPGLCR